MKKNIFKIIILLMGYMGAAGRSVQELKEVFSERVQNKGAPRTVTDFQRLRDLGVNVTGRATRFDREQHGEPEIHRRGTGWRPATAAASSSAASSGDPDGGSHTGSARRDFGIQTSFSVADAEIQSEGFSVVDFTAQAHLLVTDFTGQTDPNIAHAGVQTDDSMRRLEQDLEEKIAQIQALEAQIQSIHAIHADRSSELENLRRQLDQSKLERQALEGIISSLRGQIADKEAEMDELHQENDRLNAAIEANREEMATLTQRLEDANKALSGLRHERGVMREQIDHLEQEINHLKERLEAATSPSTDEPENETTPAAEIQEFQSTIARLEGELAEKEEELARTKAEIVKQKAHITRMTDHQAEQTERIAKLQSDHEQNQARIAALESMNAGYRQQLADSEVRARSLEERNGQLEERNAALKSQIRELRQLDTSKEQEMRAQIQSLEEEIRHLKASKRASLVTFADKFSNLAKGNKDSELLKGILSEWKSLVDRETITKQKAEMAELKNAQRLQYARIASLEARIADLQKPDPLIKQQHQEIQKLKQELAAALQSQNASEAELEQKKAMIEDLQKKIASLEKTLGILEDEQKRREDFKMLTQKASDAARRARQEAQEKKAQMENIERRKMENNRLQEEIEEQRRILASLQRDIAAIDDEDAIRTFLGGLVDDEASARDTGYLGPRVIQQSRSRPGSAVADARNKSSTGTGLGDRHVTFQQRLGNLRQGQRLGNLRRPNSASSSTDPTGFSQSGRLNYMTDATEAAQSQMVKAFEDARRAGNFRPEPRVNRGGFPAIPATHIYGENPRTAVSRGSLPGRPYDQLLRGGDGLSPNPNPVQYTVRPDQARGQSRLDAGIEPVASGLSRVSSAPSLRANPEELLLLTRGGKTYMGQPVPNGTQFPPGYKVIERANLVEVGKRK